MNPTQIDFVIPWVDGSDPLWQRRRAAVSGDNLADDRPQRYRDWGLLPYWFRAVEKYAPWVRKIHFICDQAPPQWLNTEHPKLHIVKHTDYIPAQYLPTFQANPIELNLHRIEGLSEQFVYFNDDMYLLRPMAPEAFFKKGLPVDNAVMNPVSTADLLAGNGDNKIFYIAYNDVQYLNRRYSLRDCIRRHPGKWFAPVYGKYLLRNLTVLSWPRFLGFRLEHLPQPFLKKTFEKAWQTDYDILDATSRHPLRHDHDVNQWLLRMFQLAEGDFCPGVPKAAAFFNLSEDNTAIVNIITGQTQPMICINDASVPEASLDAVRRELLDAFDRILPQKSAFEK